LAGRLTSVDNTRTPGVPTVVLSYTYDAVDNTLTTTDTINGQLKGTESYTYDALYRVTRITQSGNGVIDKRVDLTYDAASQRTNIARYSDLLGTQSVATSDYSYDLAGRLTRLTHKRGTTTYADYQWTYDAANRITEFISPDGTSGYSYDDRDQLTDTDHSYQTDEAYSYDANGNRTNAGYHTGTNNQLLSDGTYDYTYDNEGNRTSRTNIATGEVTQYAWDYRNHLTSVLTQDSSGAVTKSVAYTYDVFGQRIAKIIDADGAGSAPAQIERMVYDGDNIALTFDGAGNQTHRYLYGTGVDQILADETSTSVNWALVDNLGSVRDIISSNGTVLDHIVYDSYGQVMSETNTNFDFRYGYTGRERDKETGLNYYRARYYDAATGDFISEDPMGFVAGDYNLSRYVFGSPTNGTDPSGLFTDPGGKYTGGLLQKIATKIAPLAKALKFGGKLLGPLGKIYDNLIDTEPLTNNEEAFLNPKRKGNTKLEPASKKYFEGIPAPTTYPAPIVNAEPDTDPNRCEERKKKKECFPGMIEGGSYYQVRAFNLGGQANHMPAWNSVEQSGILLGKLGEVNVQYRKNGKNIPKSEGFLIAPALCMSSEDHRKTATYGNTLRGAPKSAQAILISQGMFLDAQQLDINNGVCKVVCVSE
jgi:RHS repeat-associated protein